MNSVTINNHRRAVFFGCFLLIAILVGWSTAFAQQGDYLLEGNLVVKSGETFKYQLSFREKRGHLKGHSLTWLEGGKPSKANISGTIDKKRNTIYFTEEATGELVDTKETTICYISGTLAYQLSGDKYIVTGAFTGKDKNDKYCGEGNLRLTHPAAQDKVLGNYKEVVKAPPVPAPQPEEKPTTTGSVTNIGTVTAIAHQDIAWKTDSCILYIWQYAPRDTDAVSIKYNGKELVHNLTLSKAKKRLVLPTIRKINQLEIVAENEGSHPPNRARIMLAGDGNQYFLTIYNERGKTATVFLKK